MPGIHTFYDGSKILEPFAETIGIEADRVSELLFKKIVRNFTMSGQLRAQFICQFWNLVRLPENMFIESSESTSSNGRSSDNWDSTGVFLFWKVFLCESLSKPPNPSFPEPLSIFLQTLSEVMLLCTLPLQLKFTSQKLHQATKIIYEFSDLC